jgi:hypothetical protein
MNYLKTSKREREREKEREREREREEESTYEQIVDRKMPRRV